jgi:ribosomal protein S18 acetylase RimI-like enzyme
MQSPTIRRAIPSDAAALSTFAASVFALGCPETAASDLAAYIAAELAPASVLTLLDDPNIFVLLAETSAPAGSALPTGPSIVAYMVVARRSPHPHLSATAPAEFRKLYLDPIYHGSGLAGALVQEALAILRDEGPCPIWLSVFSENSRAIVFYKKWEFRIVGPQEFVVGADRQKDFLMLRDPEANPASGG